MPNITVVQNKKVLTVRPRTVVKAFTPGPQGAKGDPGEGVIAGGTTGQVLRKASNVDYDMEWATAAGTGDVVGPASTADESFPIFDGTTGKLLKEFSAGQVLTALGVEPGATADQTAAEIKAAYITQPNTFQDADRTKLDGIEAGATADQTGSEIKALYEAEPNAFTDTKNTKLAGIEDGATADQTGSEIKALYEAEANAYTDAKDTKLSGIEVGATADQTVKRSVAIDADSIQLTGDVDAPGNNKVYGTDGAGARGWKDDPAGGSAPKNSIEIDAGELQLVGDTAAPGLNKVYGTDGTGNKGWKNDPAGGGSGDVVGPTGATNENFAVYDGTTGKTIKEFTPTQARTALNVEDGAAAPPYGTSDLSDGAVTLAKIQDIATGSILGRVTALTGDLEVLTPAQVRTLINVEDGAAADQSASEVPFTPTGGIAASTVQAAIAELDSEAEKLANKNAAGGYIGADAGGQVATARIADLAVTTAKIAASNVSNAKLADMTQATIKGRASGAGTGAPVDLTATQVRTIINVEDGATADQTGAEIKALYEAEPNAFTDTKNTKLAGIEDGATADQTGAEIKTLYTSQPNTFQDADRTKLDGIEAGAAADQSSSEVPDDSGVGGADVAASLDLLDSAVTALDAATEKVANKNAASGYIGADAGGQVATARIADLAVTLPKLADLPTRTVIGDLGSGVEAVGTDSLRELIGTRKKFLNIDQTWPIQTLDTKNVEWVAGDAASAPSALDHTDGDLYPWMTFDAIDQNGYPHHKHNDLGGANQDSQYYGYLHGLMIRAGMLNDGGRILFEFSGYMENTYDPDSFVEICIEPNPVLDTYNGANRMRCLTGELGATWTGKKAVHYRAIFEMGAAINQDEYTLTWELEIEDIVAITDVIRVEGGQNFKENDVNLSPRFRVDHIDNIDTYDATHQGATTLRLKFDRRVMRPI